MNRCAWVPPQDDLYAAYHDEEWGVPSHDDRHLFELLILEGAQAGLSWATILRKRENYRRAFAGFDPEQVVRLDPEQLLADAGIVRNRLKVESAVGNAARVLEVQAELGSLDAYLWQFVGGEPIVNARRSTGEIPSQTTESETMSKLSPSTIGEGTYATPLLVRQTIFEFVTLPRPSGLMASK